MTTAGTAETTHVQVVIEGHQVKSIYKTFKVVLVIAFAHQTSANNIIIVSDCWSSWISGYMKYTPRWL